MAIYYCHNCDNLLDGDYDTPVEHPWPSHKDELVCEHCAAELEEEMIECIKEDRRDL